MKLVVDTNILFSFFRENPVRSIIVNASFYGLSLYAPVYAFEELIALKKELQQYTKSKEDEIELLLTELKKYVVIKPSLFFIEYEEESKKITPDQKDAPFFALALKLNAFIWSNEPRLKRQKRITVLNTQEVRILFEV
jgi:predicted nucleic acid-binding protein